jgi:hypothetical protein
VSRRHADLFASALADARARSRASRGVDVHPTERHEGSCNGCRALAVWTVHLGPTGGLEVRLCPACRDELVRKTTRLP